jgi:hypothetical protein
LIVIIPFVISAFVIVQVFFLPLPNAATTTTTAAAIIVCSSIDLDYQSHHQQHVKLPPTYYHLCAIFQSIRGLDTKDQSTW